MYYVYHFDIAAIFITAMLLLTISLRRAYPSRSCKIYKILLSFNLISALADVISVYTITYYDQVNIMFNYLANMTYYFAHSMTAVLFLLYLITFIRGNLGTKGEEILWISAASIDGALVITNPLTNLLFYFDETGAYNRGPLMPVLYLTSFVTLGYCFFLFVKYNSLMSKFQTATYLTFLLLIVGAIVFQFLFPKYLVESFSIAIAFMMMNVALDNPAMYFYRNSYCFNQYAFDTTLREKFKLNADFTFLCFMFDDIAVFKKNFGDAVFARLIEKSIELCHKTFGSKKVYYLGNGVFVVDVTNKVVDQEIHRIDDVLGKEFVIGTAETERTVRMSPHYCVVSHPGPVETVGDVNNAINVMLYDAYQTTGERVIYDNADIFTQKRREEEIIHILRDAIANDGFEVYYQPILEQRTKKFVSAEALVRLKSTGLGFIGPDEFIPIAERNGMIQEIGETVFEKVCRFWRNSKVAELGIKYLEVNISVMQLYETNLSDRFAELCNRYGVSPRNINIEITETVGTSRETSHLVKENINKLLDKGFSFSLDDYGSGYSTATYLAEIPFRIVKIDKNILWSAMKEKEFKIILDHSVRLVKEFGRECVVEGVENEAMVSVLTELGCDYFQGYLYSKPIPEDKFVEFLTPTTALNP